MVRIGHVTIRGFNSRDCDPRLVFREELLRHNLTPYISRRLREEPDFFDMFDQPPLFAALTPMSISNSESPAPVPGILDILLRRGENPNVIPRAPMTDVVSPWVIFSRGVMSVFNMLSGPCMFPALRFNDTLNNGLFDLLLSHGANPNQPLLNRRSAHTVFSHFLIIALSKFLGPECFDGYLRTLDAFLRAGASFGVPSIVGVADSEGGETAFGNLARSRPDESLLTSYCIELKTLQVRLATDPERRKFISTVTEMLIFHCSGKEEYIGEPLLQPDPEIEIFRQMKHKRQQESWGEGSFGSPVKHFRGK